MANRTELDFQVDALTLISLIATFVSIFISINVNLSFFEIIASISVFFTILALSLHIPFKRVLSRQSEAIKKLEEKINIYREIGELKARMNVLERSKK